MPTHGLVLLADPPIAAMPVAECGEPLCAVSEGDGLVLDTRKRDPLDAYALVRAGVLTRLRAAQAALPEGVRLLLIEGYRPVDLQRRYFDDHAARLARGHPDWDAVRVRREASAYVSPVDVAPHCTGGAVDLSLCTADGELDLGTEVNATPEDSAEACFTASTTVDEAAAGNRHLLIAAMGSAGFVNYPTEWWHWSFGDRYWAYGSAAPAAVYGPCRPPGVDGRPLASARYGASRWHSTASCPLHAPDRGAPRALTRAPGPRGRAVRSLLLRPS